MNVRATLSAPKSAIALCTTVSDDGKILCIGFSDCTIRQFHRDLNYKLSPTVLGTTLAHAPTMQGPVNGIRFRPEGFGKYRNLLLASCADGSLTQWHIGSHVVRRLAKEADCVNVADYRPDACCFATAGNNCVVRLYDEERFTPIAEMTQGPPGGAAFAHSLRIQALRFRNDNVLVTGGWDSTVHVWDVRAGRSSGYLYGPYLCADSLDLYNTMLVTASCRTENQLEVWDLRKMEKLQTHAIQGATDTPARAYAARFDSSGTRVAIAGNGFVQVFDVAEDRLLKASEKHSARCCFYATSWSPDGTHLCVAGDETMVFEALPT